MTLHNLILEFSQEKQIPTRNEITKEQVKSMKYYFGGLITKVISMLSISALIPILKAKNIITEEMAKHGYQFSVSLLFISLILMIYGGVRSFKIDRADLQYAKRFEEDIIKLTEKYGAEKIYDKDMGHIDRVLVGVALHYSRIIRQFEEILLAIKRKDKKLTYERYVKDYPDVHEFELKLEKIIPELTRTEFKTVIRTILNKY